MVGLAPGSAVNGARASGWIVRCVDPHRIGRACWSCGSSRGSWVSRRGGAPCDYLARRAGPDDARRRPGRPDRRHPNRAGLVRSSRSWDAAGRIEAADYSVRVSEDRGPRRHARLSAAFNAMAARLRAEDADAAACSPMSATSCGRRRRRPGQSSRPPAGRRLPAGRGPHPSDPRRDQVLEPTPSMTFGPWSLAESGRALHREPTDPAVLLEDVGLPIGRALGDLDRDRGRGGAQWPAPIEIDPVRMRYVSRTRRQRSPRDARRRHDPSSASRPAGCAPNPPRAGATSR